MSAVKKLILVLVILAIGGGAAMMFRKPSSQRQEVAAVQSKVTFREDSEDRLDLDAAETESSRQGVPLPTKEKPASTTAEKPVASKPPALPVAPDFGRREPVVPRMEALESPEMAMVQPDRPQAAPSIPSAFDRGARPPLPELGKEGPQRFSNVSVTPPAPPRLASPPRAATPPPENTSTIADTAVVDPPDFLSHTIVNGDTLTRLAQRYLGSGDRYNEIYDLNREVLASPDVLPLGRKLKIPPRKAPPVVAEVPVLPAASQVTAPPPSPRLVPLPPDAFFRRQ